MRKAFSLRCQKFLHLNSSECARCKSHRTVLYFFSQAQRCINLIAIHSNGSQRQSKCPFTSRWFPENRQWDNTLGHLILQWLKDEHYGTMWWGFLPSDGTHVKQINGFIPVPSVNLLAVSKDMQTNFIHQKQKISLSGKTCFFFPLEKCKYKGQNMQQFMGKLCIPLQCVTCSQRGGLDQFVNIWEGKLDLEILWNMSFPLLLLWNTQLQKKAKDYKWEYELTIFFTLISSYDG